VPLLGVVLLNLPWKTLANKQALNLCGALYLLLVLEALVVPEASWNAPLMAEPLFGATPVVDSLARVMFLSIGMVGLAAVMVARYVGMEVESQFRFANLLLLAGAGMNGVVITQDLFGLYVFLEVTAVTSFILIAMDLGKPALEGAFKYMVLSAVATGLMLGGLALLLVAAGTTSFDGVAQAIRQLSTNKLVGVAMALYVAGLAVKAGLVPFHGWLPDAYSAAPAPVSVFLAGIVTKVSGVYTLIRLCQSVFGLTTQVKTALVVVGLVSIVVGAVGALAQRDMKRMLAYSSISQVGYIVLGLGAGSALGIAGAVFHFFNHAIFKTTLFANAAALEKQAGTTDMEKLGGLQARMPVTSVTSVIVILSTAGIPPLSGFWSKVMIVVAAWQAGFQWSAGIAILASLLTLSYFLVMQRKVFFGKVAPSCAEVKEAGGWALLPVVLLAATTVALGVGFPWLFETFLLPVRSFL
jgi:multicomponent Na+:H+ antiporter subunit D